jgi:hypothetical protein
MPDQELQVQKKTKNKEKREWKKKIREEKQESNFICRFETVINSLLSSALRDWNFLYTNLILGYFLYITITI